MARGQHKIRIFLCYVFVSSIVVCVAVRKVKFDAVFIIHKPSYCSPTRCSTQFYSHMEMTASVLV